MKNYFFYVLLICTVCFISCTKENEEESGSQSTIVSKLKSSTVSDIDGNVYNTVTIGDQTWMVENLKVTRYYDGTSISNVTDNESWNSLSTPAYCWYNNDESYKSTYGALYN